jgi:hypothetical protein
MVKKIRVIDEPKEETTMDEDDFRKNIMELAKSADWKLWELLQTMQRLEKKLSVIDPDEDSE